jgi:hypothetical protein
VQLFSAHLSFTRSLSSLSPGSPSSLSLSLSLSLSQAKTKRKGENKATDEPAIFVPLVRHGGRGRDGLVSGRTVPAVRQWPPCVRSDVTGRDQPPCRPVRAVNAHGTAA